MKKMIEGVTSGHRQTLFLSQGGQMLRTNIKFSKEEVAVDYNSSSHVDNWSHVIYWRESM